MHVTTYTTMPLLSPFFTIEDKILSENLTNIFKFSWVIHHKQYPIKISKGTREPCLFQLCCQQQTRGSRHAEQWKCCIICNLNQLGGQSTIFSLRR